MVASQGIKLMQRNENVKSLALEVYSVSPGRDLQPNQPRHNLKLS